MAIKQPANSKCLRWDSRFSTKWNNRLNRAQMFIDSEVLRLDDPLTPKKTGFLINSAKLGTKIGSGEINQIAPYAAYQYYETSETRSYDPNRGAQWFERMKAAHKDDILKGAQNF